MSDHRRSGEPPTAAPTAAPAAEESADEVPAAPATEEIPAPLPEQAAGHRPAPDWWDDDTDPSPAGD
jgi:hypothetical protein